MPAFGWGDRGNSPEKLNPGHEINEAAKVLATGHSNGTPNYNSTPNTVSDVYKQCCKTAIKHPYTATPGPPHSLTKCALDFQDPLDPNTN